MNALADGYTEASPTLRSEKGLCHGMAYGICTGLGIFRIAGKWWEGSINLELVPLYLIHLTAL